MCVKVVRLVGDGLAVVVRPDAVRGVVAHGRGSCSDRGEGVPISPGLKRLARVGLCASFAPYIYIIGKTNYFNEKTKNSLFLFGYIKISLYICTRKQERINNTIKIQDYEKAN